MSAHPEAATSGAVYTRPLPFVRRASDRRIEVFSPKLGRRLSLSSYAAWQLWLALEANPAASTFCERPAFIEGTPRRTIDFWVRFSRQGGDEFWLLDDAEESAHDTASTKTTEQSAAHSLPVEQSKFVTVREARLTSDGQPEIDTFAHAVCEAVCADAQLTQGAEFRLTLPAPGRITSNGDSESWVRRVSCSSAGLSDMGQINVGANS